MKKINEGKSKKIIVLGMLMIMISVAGCGTAGDAVTKLESPDRPAALEATTLPDENLITVQQNASPSDDYVVGSAGAVEAEAVVKVYEVYPGGTAIYSMTAAADGSFSLNIGDDDPQTVIFYLTATAPDKAESSELGLSNM